MIGSESSIGKTEIPHNEEKPEKAGGSVSDDSTEIGSHELEATLFHSQLAATLEIHYNDNDPDAIFIPEGFDGVWENVSPSEYWAHVLSIEGVDHEDVLIPPAAVTAVLNERRELFMSHEAQVDTIERSFKDFNEQVKGFGLSVGKFDANKIFLLTGGRINEVLDANGFEVLDHDTQAVTLTKFGQEIFIPVDDVELMENQNHLYDVVVHELGHAARPENFSSEEVPIEEGIVQLNARDIERDNGCESERTDRIYNFEVTMASHLQDALGEESLMPYTQDEIRSKFNEIHASLVFSDGAEPYDTLLSDMRSYDGFYQQLVVEYSQVDENERSSAVPRFQTMLAARRDEVIEKWFG